MNLSYRWLQALLPGLVQTPEWIAARLAAYGAPVDEIRPIGAALGDIRIARVIEAIQHPNADRLSLCKVDAGTGELLSVVCGAPNVRAGAFYPFAPVGATLPGGLQIRKAKIRGETSEGMLCSARELELGRDHDGILQLHGDYEPGAAFTQAVGLDDIRIVVDVTPNRPDLLSHIGVARELARDAGHEGPLDRMRADQATGPRWIHGESSATAAGVQVTIEHPTGCPRYIGAVIRNVRVEPSPDWLASRLRAVGLRPINTVVDITNYVLYELGQPLHAFDLARLHGEAIVVRNARPGETLVTLDGEKRVLSAEMLVIADAERPIALAGVMGGENTEVTQSTQDIFLECALFDPAFVRRSRRAVEMTTDASQRFERGVDPDLGEQAVLRALELFRSVAGGEPELEAVVVGQPRPGPVTLKLRLARVTQVLGVELDSDEVAAHLESIGFHTSADEGVLHVAVPGYRRYDVSREIDLVEEVARRRGYDSFPSDLRPFRAGTVADHPLFQLEDRLRDAMVGLGLLEARSLPFASAAGGDVELLLPLAATENRLRASLLQGLVHRLEYNFAQGNRDVRLFEIGTVFHPAADAVPQEETRLAMLLTGRRSPAHWSDGGQPLDLWDLKGLMEHVAAELGLAVAADDDPAGDPLLDAGRAFRFLVPGSDTVAGRGGRIRADRVDAPAWAGEILGCEITLDALPATTPAPHFRAIPAFPAIERDLALLAPADVPADRLDAAIRDAAGPLLEATSIFDVYRGQGIPENTRSLGFRLRFRAPDRTLTDDDADQAERRVLRRLTEDFGVERRG
jgi:phenylalanyl-tRNA synthetase beta chain